MNMFPPEFLRLKDTPILYYALTYHLGVFFHFGCELDRGVTKVISMFELVVGDSCLGR